MFLLERQFQILFRMSYYAVAKGKTSGIFRTWSECENQVKGFSGAVYKKFKTETEAQQFMREKSGGTFKSAPVLVQKYESSNDNFPSDGLDDEAFLSLPDGEPSAKKAKTTSQTSEKPSTSKSNSNKRKIPSTNGEPGNLNSKLFDIKYKKPKPTSKKIYCAEEFEQDDEGFVHVYTDGSCENNGKKNAAAGLGVYFGENHVLNSAEPVKGRATNNCGEIQASILAIKRAHQYGIKQLEIMTDSQFLIKSICIWLPNWKKRNWKLPNGKPVKNQVDFEELDKLMTETDMIIRWHYVRAHKGIHGNEMADQLAREGTAKYKLKHNIV